MPIQSFEDLDEAIQKVPGKPSVLEALWDGDTQGWMLLMDLYTEIPGATAMHAERLGIVIVTDPQLFPAAPVWPEAALALLIGQQAAEKYGITFFFPADKAPDLNCPNWTQRHLAIQCADCGKLIIPTDSPYLPKDICSPCHSVRQGNEDLQQNKLESTVTFGTCQEKDSPALRREPFLNWYLRTEVNSDNFTNEINVTIFSYERLMDIKHKMYLDTKERIANYQPSTLTGEKRKFAYFEIKSFEGKEYELEQHFHEEHRTLSHLFYLYEKFEKAEQEGWTYYLHTIKGIRYRDLSFLRYIYLTDKSATSFADKQPTSLTTMLAHYLPLLTANEIMETLKKLELLGAITIKNDEVSVTEFGENLIHAH